MAGRGGIALLFVGGATTIRNGVSAAIVGSFLVAVGTGMPELVTSTIAAMRRESDLAVGNLVGSNLFNLLMVLPASALTSPIPLPRGGVSDLGLSWLLAALLIPVFIVGKAYLGRKTGTLLLAVYVGYALARVSQDAMP